MPVNSPRSLRVAQQAVEAAAVLPAGDFARVGLADRGDMRGVEDAGLQERDAAVELDAVDRHRVLGDGERAKPVAAEQSLKRQVVDRQDRGDVETLPFI